MTIYCKLCNHRIDSKPNLNSDKAESYCLESLSRHLVTSHPVNALELKSYLESLPLLIATYLLVKGYARIPPESGSLQEHLADNEKLLLDILGAEIRQEPAGAGRNTQAS